VDIALGGAGGLVAAGAVPEAATTAAAAIPPAVTARAVLLSCSLSSSTP
jgi:hypothetical protein